MYRGHICFIHSSSDGHINLFQNLAIMGCAALNCVVLKHTLLRFDDFNSFGDTPKGGLVESHRILFLGF